MTFNPVPKRGKKPKKAKRPIARSGTPKPVNKVRKAKTFARAYGGDYADWIRDKPCCVKCLEWLHAGPMHAHHTATGGMGRKADAETLVPLCAFHHAQFHTFGRKMFEDGYLLDLKAIAAKYWAEWLALTAEEG